jgi:RNA polymerase sigma factor (sigma-70 family)
MPLFEQLYNFAHWLTQDREEAEDLVQETYAKALKGFSSFQPGTNFRAWIFQILRNTFFTSRTGLKSTAMVPLELESDQEKPSRGQGHAGEHPAPAFGSAARARSFGPIASALSRGAAPV